MFSKMFDPLRIRPATMSSSPINNESQEMVKAHTILEFTLENLEQLGGHESNFATETRRQIQSLECLRNFIKKMQKDRNYRPAVSDLVADIVYEVGELLDLTDSYLYTIQHSFFLSYSRDLSPLLLEIQYELFLQSGVTYLTQPQKYYLPKAKLEEPYNIVESVLKEHEMFLKHLRITPVIERDQLSSIYENLEFIRSFLKSVLENSNRYQTIPLDLFNRIKVGVSDFLRIKNKYVRMHDPLLSFPKIPELVQNIRSVEQEVYDALIGGGSDESAYASTEVPFTPVAISAAEEVLVIGMNDETRELLDRLIGGWKQLEVIPIIGMAGIGKTTLARKLYNDPSIARHFHIRAWTSVSQSYQERKLLRDILSSIIGEKDPVLSMRKEDIGEKLYKCLKGNKYLFVLDDVWDVQVWKDLQIYLPKDNNSSRVFITSRNKDVVQKIVPQNAFHSLRFLTDDESWDLFMHKVFGSNNISKELLKVGKEIVATCKGLPIAIVVIGGLLAKEEKTKEKWTELIKTIRSSSNSDLKYLMDILALSYKHLPYPLKSCFLYLGSFPEDYEYPVKWLIRSWIAEGLIHCTTPEMILEDVAEGYLMNLIDRSLLIVAKRRSDGGIKSCKIHDLLRDLCIKKAEEKNFLQPICKCTPKDKPSVRGLSRFSNCHYFHFYDSHFVGDNILDEKDNWKVVKLLRVLDIRRVIFDKFPEKLFELLHLKYLELQIDRIEDLPPSIFELWNLETFILNGEKGSKVELVPSIMKMRRLRHFHVSQELFCDPRKSSEFRDCGVLYNLQTISNVSSSSDSLHILLSGTPNLRKLGLHDTLSEANDIVPFPTLSNLKVLETLKFEYQTLGMKPFTISSLFDFPQSLKKLTLIGSHANWSEISIIGRLPNLEVLKLKDNFFSGPQWETTDDGFGCLKFLKLSHMDIKQWDCSSSHFPKLEELVLNGCHDLEEIPSDIGDILTLQTIKVYQSSDSVVESARQIQETQNSLGNDGLRVFISPHFQEY